MSYLETLEITKEEWNHHVRDGNGKCTEGCGYNYIFGAKGYNLYGYICPKCYPDNNKVKGTLLDILMKKEENK